MANKNDDRAQQLLQLQQTVADAQLALAEALRALSQGQAVGVAMAREAATTEDDYLHIGELEYGVRPDFTRAGPVLYLSQDPDTPSLNWLAENNKRIRLEFQLMSSCDLTEEERDRRQTKFTKLGEFLSAHAALLVPMEAQCCQPSSSCTKEIRDSDPT